MLTTIISYTHDFVVVGNGERSADTITEWNNHLSQL